MNSNKETNVSLFLKYLNLNLYSSFEILLGFFFFFCYMLSLICGTQDFYFHCSMQTPNCGMWDLVP